MDSSYCLVVSYMSPNSVNVVTSRGFISNALFKSSIAS